MPPIILEKKKTYPIKDLNESLQKKTGPNREAPFYGTKEDMQNILAVKKIQEKQQAIRQLEKYSKGGLLGKPPWESGQEVWTAYKDQTSRIQEAENIKTLIDKIRQEIDESWGDLREDELNRLGIPNQLYAIEKDFNLEHLENFHVSSIYEKAPNVIVQYDSNGDLWFKDQDKECFQPLNFTDNNTSSGSRPIGRYNWIEMHECHQITSSIMYREEKLKMDEDSDHVLITYAIDMEPEILEEYAKNGNISGYNRNLNPDNTTFILQINIGRNHFVTCVLKKEGDMITGKYMDSLKSRDCDTKVSESIHKVATLIYKDQNIRLPDREEDESKDDNSVLLNIGPVSCQQQKNSHNCGFWASYNALKEGCNYEVDKDPNDETIRQKMIDAAHPLGIAAKIELAQPLDQGDEFVAGMHVGRTNLLPKGDSPEEQDTTGKTLKSRNKGRNDSNKAPQQAVRIYRTSKSRRPRELGLPPLSFTAVIESTTNPKEKEQREKKLSSLCKPAEKILDTKSDTAQYKKEQDSISYIGKSTSLKEDDIKYMVAYSVKEFQLDPITIEGGTYRQQITAIEEALKQGFTNITINSPTGKEKRPQEYNDMVDLAEHVSQRFLNYEDCLDAIDTEQPLQILYQHVCASCQEGFKERYEKLTKMTSSPTQLNPNTKKSKKPTRSLERPTELQAGMDLEKEKDFPKDEFPELYNQNRIAKLNTEQSECVRKLVDKLYQEPRVIIDAEEWGGLGDDVRGNKEALCKSPGRDDKKKQKDLKDLLKDIIKNLSMNPQTPGKNGPK